MEFQKANKICSGLLLSIVEYLENFLYSGQSLLSDGQSRFLDGTGLDEHLQTDTSTSSVSHLTDHLGSTSQLLDSTNGSAKVRYDYKSYGRLEGDIENPVTSNAYTYTGREDDGTGLMYYRARYYDPELEVFISQDPLGDAQRYVGGNPLSFVDPLGLIGISVEYQNFPIRIPNTEIDLPVGHAGIVSVDPKTGKTKYYEYGRYRELPSGEGVRSFPIPDVKIKNGKITNSSLNHLIGYLKIHAVNELKSEGKPYKWIRITSNIDYSADAQKIINYAKSYNKPYSWNPFNESTCKSFVRGALDAAR